MYCRIKRERFDEVPDAIMAAASGIGAPMLYDPSGSHLKVISVSGGQLTSLGEKLGEIGGEILRPDRSVVLDLQMETFRCSGVFIISTSEEVIIASDRSPDEYALIAELDLDLMPEFDAFKAGCARFIRGLGRLPAASERRNQ